MGSPGLSSASGALELGRPSIASKSNGALRNCVDPIKINRHLQRDSRSNFLVFA
jgi:hypothetical protein